MHKLYALQFHVNRDQNCESQSLWGVISVKIRTEYFVFMRVLYFIDRSAVSSIGVLFR